MSELLERARRTAPAGGVAQPATVAGAADAVVLELRDVTRTVTDASAWDDRAMSATWSNMAAVQLGAAA